MHVLIISLTDSDYNTARTIQIARVANALQNSGFRISIITVVNKELTACGTNIERIIFIPGAKNNSKSYFGKMLYKTRQEFGNFFPFQTMCVRECVKKSLSLISSEKVDCLFTSSNPIYSHIAGLEIKRLTNIPWVTSFSDPRPLSILPYNRDQKKIKYTIEKHLISKILNSCNAVHMPSKHGLALYRDVFGFQPSVKLYAIPHIGQDLVAEPESMKYHGWIIHAGNLGNKRSSVPFLEAIKEVSKKIPNKFKGLLCVGIVKDEFRKEVKRLKMENLVRMIGQIPQKEALQMIMNSSAVVVLEADMMVSPFLPSKFADYAQARKSILAVTPKVSAIRDYLEKMGGGIAVSNKREEITDGLMRIFSDDISIMDGAEIYPNHLSGEFSWEAVGRQYRQMFLNHLSG